MSKDGLAAASQLHARYPEAARILAAELRNAIAPVSVVAHETGDHDLHAAVEHVCLIAHALFNSGFQRGDTVLVRVGPFSGNIGTVEGVTPDGVQCVLHNARYTFPATHIDRLL